MAPAMANFKYRANLPSKILNQSVKKKNRITDKPTAFHRFEFLTTPFLLWWAGIAQSV
jgi:hypothetical protein